MARRKSATTAQAEPASQHAEQSDEITLRGRLVADPVLRHTNSGKPVTTIRIAVNPPEGEPTFHSVVAWNRTAEVVCQFLKKGRAVEVAGRLQQRSYELADGTERQVDEVVAWRVTFISAKQLSEPAADKEVA